MRSRTQFIIFLFVIITLSLLLHVYIGNRLILSLNLYGISRLITIVAISILYTVLVATNFLVRLKPNGWVVPIAYVGYTWMGVFFLLTVFLFFSDLLFFSVSYFLPSIQNKNHIFVLVALSIVILLTIYGFWNAHRGPILKKIPIYLSKWPNSANGFKIIQLTDLHVGALLKKPFVEQVVLKTNARNPDLIVITGDLMDGSVKNLREDLSPLQKLKAKHGCIFYHRKP